MSDLWYVRTKKKDRGPYETDKLRVLAAEGRVKPESLVSRDGKQTWIKASQIQGIEFGTRDPQPKPKKPNPPQEAEIETGFDPRYGGATAKRGRDVVDAYGSRLQEAGERRLARLYYCGFISGAAATLTYTLVRLAGWFGMVKFDTVEKSLVLRVGLPILAALLGGGIAFWNSRHYADAPPQIDPEMSDEEITEAIKRR